MDAYTYAPTDTHGSYRELIPVTSQITIRPCLLMDTGMSILWTAVIGQDVFKDVVPSRWTHRALPPFLASLLPPEGNVTFGTETRLLCMDPFNITPQGHCQNGEQEAMFKLHSKTGHVVGAKPIHFRPLRSPHAMCTPAFVRVHDLHDGQGTEEKEDHLPGEPWNMLRLDRSSITPLHC